MPKRTMRKQRKRAHLRAHSANSSLLFGLKSFSGFSVERRVAQCARWGDVRVSLNQVRGFLFGVVLRGV